MTRRPLVAECRDETTFQRATQSPRSPDPTRQQSKTLQVVNTAKTSTNVSQPETCDEATRSHCCRTTQSAPIGTPLRPWRAQKTTTTTPLARDKQHVCRRTVSSCVLPIWKVVWLRQKTMIADEQAKNRTYHILIEQNRKIPLWGTPRNSNSTPAKRESPVPLSRELFFFFVDVSMLVAVCSFCYSVCASSHEGWPTTVRRRMSWATCTGIAA